MRSSQAIDAGVQCIEHGQLIDEPTAKLMAEKGIWWSLQPFLDDEDSSPFRPGVGESPEATHMFAGTDNAYALAKEYKIKTAWGTDTLFDPSWRGDRARNLRRWCAGTRRPRC